MEGKLPVGVGSEALDEQSRPTESRAPALGNVGLGRREMNVAVMKTKAEQALTETDNSLWALSANAIKILSSTEDYNEGPRAFIEKRPPVWKGK